MTAQNSQQDSTGQDKTDRIGKEDRRTRQNRQGMRIGPQDERTGQHRTAQDRTDRNTRQEDIT
jgi:hypothetical protein